MIDVLLLGLAGLMQDQGPTITAIDPPMGVTVGENRTLSQWHPGSDDRMFPDVAVKDLRLDGDTLYVLVTNQGAKSAQRIQVSARTQGSSETVRLASLTAGESKWVPMAHFRIASADTGMVAVAAKVAAVPAALDRSGQGCDSCSDGDEANNSLSASAASITRGRPE
jgi:hypothetical protein